MVREQGVRVRDIADLPWVAPALAALHAGGPLPLPFDDPASASENLGADRRKEATAANAPVTPRRPTRPSPGSTAPPQPPASRVRSVSRTTIGRFWRSSQQQTFHLFDGRTDRPGSSHWRGLSASDFLAA